MKNKFILSAVLIFAFVQAGRAESSSVNGKVYGIVIGVANSKSILAHADDRAQEFLNFLSDRFGKENLETIEFIYNEHSKESINQVQLLEKFKNFSEQIRGNSKHSLVFIYYCGHGTRFEVTNELHLSLPGDNWLLSDSLFRAVDLQLRGHYTFFIIDACHSGLSELEVRRLVPMELEKRSVIYTATHPTGQAVNGWFTEGVIASLLKGRQKHESFNDSVTQFIRQKGNRLMSPTFYSGKWLIQPLTGFSPERSVYPAIVAISPSFKNSVRIVLGKDTSEEITVPHSILESASTAGKNYAVLPLVLPENLQRIKVTSGSEIDELIEVEHSEGDFPVFVISKPGDVDSKNVIADELMLLTIGSNLQSFGYEDEAHFAYAKVAVSRAKRLPHIPSEALWQKLRETDLSEKWYGKAAQVALENETSELEVLEDEELRVKVRDIGASRLVAAYHRRNLEEIEDADLATYSLERAMGFGFASDTYRGDGPEVPMPLSPQDQSWADNYREAISVVSNSDRDSKKRQRLIDIRSLVDDYLDALQVAKNSSLVGLAINPEVANAILDGGRLAAGDRVGEEDIVPFIAGVNLVSDTKLREFPEDSEEKIRFRISSPPIIVSAPLSKSLPENSNVKFYSIGDSNVSEIAVAPQTGDVF